ncbi:AraC family transcriptional regulator [Gloeocapsopsis sp. IPPAS B-1203]|uniref:AraC family transcriptional regulator n=1 Tax=Gloeocapsopsis sp. IPPAS B-1203 TaxID=2049454 RepID=UPI000C1829B9|nr:AraC family transcriptional regulator [Gloeocapsopsis sp. IPPAS B-1203]PIG92094.1 AraC family transcriptional regulator [Gloeocapsopsis sp. IPPAS B-1203]
MQPSVTNPQKNGLQPPIYSSRAYGWQNILVEEFHQPPGEESYQSLTEHTLCISMNCRPSRLSQAIGDRRYTSLCIKGDIAIAPAGSLLVYQWNEEDRYLRIRLKAEFLQQVAQTTFDKQVKILSEFRVRNPQIEQIGMMLLSELRTGGIAGLYVESLTNVLSVHLLRNYAARQPHIAVCDWMSNSIKHLSDRQLFQVTDYISDRLADNIQLSDLAELLGLSQFHFSRCFKQSTGVSPYQYVLQQRIEHAKHLLKTTDLPIMQIALRCGFSSHSHLGKWFRQYVGVSPKTFRIS